MEDIIPLLIVMAISLIGAVGRKKKKRVGDKNIAQPQHTAKSDDFMSWIERVSGIEEEPEDPYKKAMPDIEPVVETETEPKVVKVVNEKPQNKFAQYSGLITPNQKKELVEKETKSAFEKDAIKHGDIKSTALDQKQPKIEFDLRKAVIYKEILNRKYS